MSICSIEIVERDVGLAAVSHERIEVDAHEVDEPDAVRRARRRGLPACDRRARMPPWIFGMERLDAAIHHLGEAGDVRHVDDRQAGVGQRPGGAAGRHQLETTRADEPARKIDQSPSCPTHSTSLDASWLSLSALGNRQQALVTAQPSERDDCHRERIKRETVHVVDRTIANSN